MFSRNSLISIINTGFKIFHMFPILEGFSFVSHGNEEQSAAVAMEENSANAFSLLLENGDKCFP